MSAAPPKVSVAIWTCNQQEFIADTIASALDQDYPDLEVVVADDHSEDDTPRIVGDWQQRFPDIVRPLFNRGERSIRKNVNRALTACTGELVAILDGDDLYRPGKIWAQVRAFEENPDVVICHHPVEQFDTNTGARVGMWDLNPDQPRATVADVVAKGSFLATASVMMRRQAMPPGGVPPVVDNAVDYLLAIETARGGGTILRLPEILARYRVHPAQMTNPTSRQAVVFQDVMSTLDYVERTYPDLAPRCNQGRRVFTEWEAGRRLTHSADARWVSAGLLTALRYQPWRPWLWRSLVSVNARAAARRLRPGA